MKIRSLDNPEDLLNVFENEQGDVYISITSESRNPCIRVGGVKSGHEMPARLHNILHALAAEFKRYENCRFESDALKKEDRVADTQNAGFSTGPLTKSTTSTNSHSMNEKINRRIKALYALIVSAIRDLITPYTDGVQMKHMYRYIDNDLEQSIDRIKKAQLVNGKVVITYDSNTGETAAADVYSNDDEDFDNEDVLVLDDIVPDFSVLDFVHSIWQDLDIYTIPRIENALPRHKKDSGNA